MFCCIFFCLVTSLNGKSPANVINVTGTDYSLDDYKTGIYIIIGTDGGNNIGTNLPVGTVSEVLIINNIQIALAFDGKYFIRFNWGDWKKWTEI